VNERWTYHILSDPDRKPTGFRITLSDRDADQQAIIQLTVVGEQVVVDDEEQDYEAMEWKVLEILDTAREQDDAKALLQAVKDHLRAQLA
jgi:hypothetical protein